MMVQVDIPTQRYADQASSVMAQAPSLTKQRLKSAHQIKIYTSVGGVIQPKTWTMRKRQDPVDSHTIIIAKDPGC